MNIKRKLWERSKRAVALMMVLLIVAGMPNIYAGAWWDESSLSDDLPILAGRAINFSPINFPSQVTIDEGDSLSFSMVVTADTFIPDFIPDHWTGGSSGITPPMIPILPDEEDEEEYECEEYGEHCECEPIDYETPEYPYPPVSGDPGYPYPPEDCPPMAHHENEGHLWNVPEVVAYFIPRTDTNLLIVLGTRWQTGTGPQRTIQFYFEALPDEEGVPFPDAGVRMPPYGRAHLDASGALIPGAGPGTANVQTFRLFHTRNRHNIMLMQAEGNL